jgi:hypothetical protein
MARLGLTQALNAWHSRKSSSSVGAHIPHDEVPQHRLAPNFRHAIADASKTSAGFLLSGFIATAPAVFSTAYWTSVQDD